MSPEFKFTETVVVGVPGETVEVCVERDIKSGDGGVFDLSVSLNGERAQFPFINKVSVRFSLGAPTACFDLAIAKTVINDCVLSLPGSEEVLRVLVKEGKEMRMCGPVQHTSSVSADDAWAVDAFGNYYSESAIKLPKIIENTSNSNAAENAVNTNCGCDDLGFSLNIFEPYFEDCIYGTSGGFDDATNGIERRTAFCAALTYMEQLITPNETICNPSNEEKRVNIKILPYIQPNDYPVELAPISELVLGYATPFYRTRQDNGVSYTWPWRVINGGDYPFLDEVYHASIRLNFTHVSWHLNYNADVSDGNYDLYSVVLHELTHAIGFISSFNSTSGELGSRSGAGQYLNYDQHLKVHTDNSAPPANLIENDDSEYGFSFSNSWHFNTEVDGLGINDPDDPSDLHSSCPQTGPLVVFGGEVSDFPVYTGEQFEQGSSFSHLGGNCPPPGGETTEYVMKTTLRTGEENRIYHWQELDVLRTLGYNVDCSSGDFFDDNPGDDLSFDCNQSDENCSVASLNDLGSNLDECGTSNSILSYGKCIGETEITINRQSLENLLLFNDPINAEIAFIEPVSPTLSDSWAVNTNDYVFSAPSFGNFMFVYALVDCNGGVSNTSVFSISVFLGQDCEGPPCEETTCSDFDGVENWEECINLPLIRNDCNLICNGQFNGTYAFDPTYNNVTDLGYRLFYYSFGAYDPFHIISIDPVGFSKIFSPTGWLKGTGTPDLVLDDELNASFRGGSLESVYTFLNSTPEIESNYLFGGSLFKTSTSDASDLVQEISLIQAEFYTVCDVQPPISFGNNSCYAEGAPQFKLIEPSSYDYPEGENSIRIGRCFKVDEKYDALLIKALPFDQSEGIFSGYDDIELIRDDFSAGVDVESPFCGTAITLGEVFCMLSDLHIQYNWYEAGNDTPIHTYDVLNGTVNGDASFEVAPLQTTTYRLERTILDLGGIDDSFEFCETSDEVTITVLEQFPIADFTAEDIEGECGVFDFFSDPSTVGNEHMWYLNEQTEEAFFSSEVNPADIVVSNGMNTIIHVVEGRCGTDIFELELPEIDCDCDTPSFTCPCEGPDAINIQAGDGTLLSDLITSGAIPAAGINGGCLAVNGELIIDTEATGNGGYYVIESSEVRMQPGSGITVQADAGLRVRWSVGGGVHGCSALWKGIELAPSDSDLGINGGRLDLYGATVKDAVHAVEFGAGSTFQMYLSTLDRNHIGLYAKPTPQSFQSNYVLQPTPPYLSSIRSSGDLLPPYECQEVQTGTNSYAGIELNDFRLLNLGTGTFPMSISESNYGIVLKNSGVHMTNSRIYNLSTNPTDPNSGTGIFTDEYGYVSLTECRMYNLRNGILGSNTWVFAQGNVFGEDPSGNRGNIERGISLDLDVSNVVRLNNQNEIYAQEHCLVTRTTHKAYWVTVADNTFELYPPDEGVINLDAVRLGDALLSGENEGIDVYNNTINLHASGNGIGLYNVNGVDLENNTINFLPSYQATESHYGLLLHQASDNSVYGNTVTGNSATDSDGGIFVLDGDRNSLCCNSVENTNFGVRFSGICEATRLRYTNFEGNNVGLQCDNGTRIGVQAAAGNIWDESINSQAVHLSTDLADVNQSRFRVEGLPGTIYWPDNVQVAAGEANWFTFGQSAMSCEEDQSYCQRPIINSLSSDTEYTDKVTGKEFYYGDYPVTSEWEANRALYRSQSSASTQQQSEWSSAGSTFYNQQQQEKSVLHQLTTVAQTLEKGVSYSGELENVLSEIGIIRQRLYDLDLMIVEGEEPSVAYLNDRRQLMAQLRSAIGTVSNVSTQKQTDYQYIIDQLVADNNSITTNHEAAAATKAVNTAYFQTLAKKAFTAMPANQEYLLREIAEKCPQRYGSAVRRAQSILLQYGIPFTPTDVCNDDGKNADDSFGDQKRSQSNPSASFGTGSGLTVYPNPVTDVLTVRLNTMVTGEYTIQILNANGQVMRTELGEGPQLLIDVNNYAPGMYWVRCRSAKKLVSRRVIIR